MLYNLYLTVGQDIATSSLEFLVFQSEKIH